MDGVAILGAGAVGGALAGRLAGAGIRVHLGVRDPAKAQALVARLGGAARALPPAEATAGADLVLLAVPAAAALAAARGAGDLRGKALVDCTNPLRWDGGPVWAPPAEGSMAQALAAALPGVAVVKGFNHFGAEIMADPALAGGPADAFFAGDDAGAKQQVLALAARLGFRVHDVGPLRNAAVLENLAVLWIHLALAAGQGRQFGFRLAGRA